jgi:hypothetical protein
MPSIAQLTGFYPRVQPEVTLPQEETQHIGGCLGLQSQRVGDQLVPAPAGQQSPESPLVVHIRGVAGADGQHPHVFDPLVKLGECLGESDDGRVVGPETAIHQEMGSDLLGVEECRRGTGGQDGVL